MWRVREHTMLSEYKLYTQSRHKHRHTEKWKWKWGLLCRRRETIRCACRRMLSVIYSNAFDYSIVRVIYLWNHVLCSRLLTSPFQRKLFGWLQDSNSYLKRPSFVMIVESAESDTQIFRIFYSIFCAIKIYRRRMDEVKDRPNVRLCYSFEFEWDSCRHHKQICQSHNFCQWQKCLLQLRTADVCDAMTCHGRRTSDWCMFDMHRRDTFARFFYLATHTTDAADAFYRFSMHTIRIHALHPSDEIEGYFCSKRFRVDQTCSIKSNIFRPSTVVVALMLPVLHIRVYWHRR